MAIREELLQRAAEMRANGATWDAVAKALKRSPDTVRGWPRLHAERWAAALEYAKAQTLEEASAETLHTLRHQLRSPDEKIANQAARSVTQLQLGLLKSRPSAPEPDATSAIVDPAALRVLAHFQGFPDADLERFALAVRPDLAGEVSARPEQDSAVVAI